MPLRKANQIIDIYGHRYDTDVDTPTSQSVSVPGPNGQPININININLNFGDIIDKLLKAGLSQRTARETVEQLLEERREQRQLLLESDDED